MKTNIFKIAAVVLVFAGSFASCKNANEMEPKYDIYENHEIAACGINDPLRNMEWLKEYCDSIKELQNISRITIDLYKIINTDEHVFKIGVSYLDFAVPYSEYWRNYTGEFIFNIHSGSPPNPEVVENFMKDKEFVAELFHFIRQ